MEDFEQLVPNTFNEDFSIAEQFGKKAVFDTFRRCMHEWKHDYKMLTALTIVVNHRCWAWYKEDKEMSRLYADLFYSAQQYALDHLTTEEFRYYHRLTD